MTVSSAEASDVADLSFRGAAAPAAEPAMPSSLVSLLSRSHAIAAMALVLFALAAFVPGIAAVPPVDRDESRFVQATRQMHERADYVDIRFGEEARYKKPVGAYWAQAIATSLLGADRAPIWAYRLPSVLGGILAVLSTYALGVMLFGRRAGILAAILIGAVLGIAIEARLAKADALLIGLTTLAQALLARAVFAQADGRRPRTILTSAAFGAAVGLGVLVKGPIILLVVLATTIAFGLAARSWAWMRRIYSWPAALAVVLAVAPWTLAIWQQSGSAFFVQALGRDLGAKLLAGQEGHGAPPGLHLLLLPFVAWPMTAFALTALPILRERRDPAVLFCLCWIVPAWLVFELVPSKLPHYSLPLYPAIALLAAGATTRGALLGPTSRRALAILAVLLPVAAALATLGAFLYLTRRIPFGLEVLFAASIGFAGLSAAAVFRERLEAGVLHAGASAVFLFAALFAIALPAARPFMLTEQILDAVRASMPCRPVSLASTRYREPSLVFGAGTETRFLDVADAPAFLSAHSCAVVVIDAREVAALQDAAAATALPIERSAEVEGFNYSRGQWQRLVLFRRAAAQ